MNKKKKDRFVHEFACLHVILGNDGENEGRTNVSRSTSAAASTFPLLISCFVLIETKENICIHRYFFSLEVTTSKSDTMKSATSSSAASSREV